MLNGVYTPKLIGQYRKGTSESLLHGKPPTRWPTELCRWSIELSHFRNAIPLIRIRAYTFLYDENRPPAIPMMRCSLRFSEMTEWKIAAIERLLYPPDRWSGGGGVPALSSSYRVHMYLAFYRLFLKDDFCHWNEWEKSTFPGISTYSAKIA